MGECLFAIVSLPAYTPQLIAFLIALIEFIAIVIAYIVREIRRKKTFYGREDFEDIPEEEKMEHEGAIMGKNNEELRIVQSADRTVEVEPGTAPTPNAVKVMVRRKKARSISGQLDLPAKAMTSANGMDIRFTLDVDRTARGFEFITLIQKSLEEIEEFNNIRRKLSASAEERLCDFLVRKMRTILEESTQRKWVVHGVIQNKIWKINGQENLLEKGGDIRTQQMLRITAQGPTTPIIILAYMIEVDVKPEQMRIHMSQSPVAFTTRMSKSKVPMESATQSLSRTFEKTPAVMRKNSPGAPKLTTPADLTNYLTTLRTMSTLPSEKLPTVMDTIARSKGSKKKDAGISPSTKHAQGPKRSIARSIGGRIIKQRKRSKSIPQNARMGSVGRTMKSPTTNKRKTTPSDTDTHSKPGSAHSTDKQTTDCTQT